MSGNFLYDLLGGIERKKQGVWKRFLFPSFVNPIQVIYGNLLSFPFPFFLLLLPLSSGFRRLSFFAELGFFRGFTVIERRRGQRSFLLFDSFPIYLYSAHAFVAAEVDLWAGGWSRLCRYASDEHLLYGSRRPWDKQREPSP